MAKYMGIKYLKFLLIPHFCKDNKKYFCDSVCLIFLNTIIYIWYLFLLTFVYIGIKKGHVKYVYVVSTNDIFTLVVNFTNIVIFI